MLDHPCEQCVLGWVEDPEVVCICVVRPLNAVAAWQLGQPLTAGIMVRHAVVVSYRAHPEEAVRRILATIASAPQRSVALCALDVTQRIKSQLFWSMPRQPSPATNLACAQSWDAKEHENRGVQGDGSCKTHTRMRRHLCL